MNNAIKNVKIEIQIVQFLMLERSDDFICNRKTIPVNGDKIKIDNNGRLSCKKNTMAPNLISK